MCGICGLSYSDRRIGDREVLQEMNEAIHYRGPDSDGFYSAEGVGLAIRRLAIIDVKGGDQPISNEDGSLWVVLNGEIYNYPSMREELENAAIGSRPGRIRNASCTTMKTRARHASGIFEVCSLLLYGTRAGIGC